MWVVYVKEMLELLRDRKTFVFTLLIPVLAMPLIFAGFGFVSSAMFKKEQQAELPFAIVGKQHAPALSRRFAEEAAFREVVLAPGEEVKQAIDSGRLRFALVIPAGMEAALRGHRQASITLHHNNAVPMDVVKGRVAAVLDEHNTALRAEALSALKMSKSDLDYALDPIRLDEQSTAGQREKVGSVVGVFLPYILLTVCLMAAMYPAVDLGAGEKEHGTLETLLLAPLPRSSLVLAKFLVLFTVGLTSALLMVASLGLVASLLGSVLQGSVAQMVESIGAVDLLMIAVMLLPTAAIFAALLLAISIYAKSYKEATGMISPLMMLLLVPIVVAMLPGVELNWFWSMVPLTNVSLAMKELVKGTMDYWMLGVILLSTSVIAGVLLAWCRWWFGREEVLFRS